MGDKREGEEVPSSKKEGKGREGRKEMVLEYSKMDGKLEGENTTILGLQVLVQYKELVHIIAQLYEWCPHDGNALSWGGRSEVQRGVEMRKQQKERWDSSSFFLPPQ